MFHSLIPTLTLLILHFDGSLIPQTSPLRPLASCSAVIIHNNGTTLAIGGRVFLPSQIPSSFTSAHAEYEGLTLGLRFLSSLSDDIKLSTINNEYDNIAIRGDCKTVVNQLKGQSSPRKLKQEHDIVTSFLSSITKRKYNIEFIPREENERADAISRSAVTALRHHLRSTLLHRSSTSSSSPLSEISQRLDVLTVATTTTAGLLPQHERIELLMGMGEEAREAKNIDVMSRVGDALRVEANRFSDFQKNTMKGRRGNSSSSKLWKREREGIDMLGVRLQLEALRISEKDKEADMLERKYRYRLGSSQKYEGYHVNRGDYMSDPAKSVFQSFEGDDKEWLASKESWEKLVAESLDVSNIFEVNDDNCALCKESGVWFLNL